MALDDDVRQIKSDVTDLKRRHLSVDRTGFYIMTAIAMLGAVRSCEILKKYEKTLQVQVQNVIGQEAPEKFYEINGQRFYLEVDGKPVEQYFKE